ncbi:ABC transporter permease [Microbacterium sp. SSW1-59]|uniref:ABC transporter permease n=1 Tax=Microbacterium xanthum TaxID=3079794 RepID=UPI002AD44FE0|nr:ABC transporter permease [Microbacterium sp. SSW1-59]MDZ8200905.1 ABC transporter permease [Microbacterium sp. SSW1-59]
MSAASGRLRSLRDLLHRAVNGPRLATTSLQIVAVALSLVFAMLLLGVVLALYGTSPTAVVSVVGQYAMTPEGWVAIVNKGTTYYIAGLAAAIGFRMYLFNIGIDGQYRLGVFFAAVVGGWLSLPWFLHIPIMVAVAAAVAGAYAAIAGYLKARRGVSEVISTIMLNAIATGVIAYLISPDQLGVQEEGSNNIQTALIPESGWLPAITIPGAGEVYGFAAIAVLIGVAYWYVTTRTRFGFQLTAVGAAPRASLLAGIDPKRMILLTMVVSGVIAGLCGMPELLGSTHRYGISFPAGLAWAGLSIAIVGRNHPLGVALAALLWAFLERCSVPLDLIGIPKEVVQVVQAIVVLAVVTSYELVHRYSASRERRRAARFAAREEVPA